MSAAHPSFLPQYTDEQYARALEMLRADPSLSAGAISRAIGISDEAGFKAREELGLPRLVLQEANVNGRRLRIPQAKADEVRRLLMENPHMTDIEAATTAGVGKQSVHNIRRALELSPAVDRSKRSQISKIRRLTAKGYRADAIAEQLGITRGVVRTRAKQGDITLHDDVIRHLPKTKGSFKVLEQTVLDLEACAAACRTVPVQLNSIDAASAADFAEAIGKSMATFADLRRRLLEKCNGIPA